MTKYKEILRLHSQGISGRGIASSLKCSRNTVSKVLKLAKEHDLEWPFDSSMGDAELESIFNPKPDKSSQKRQPDFDHVHSELAKSGVTLSLLWHEYCEECRENKESPYMYNYYCKLYRRHILKTKATMRIHRKPGEKLEVDWAGKTATVINDENGEQIKAYIFVATLPYSMYSYVQAFPDMAMESWITGHVNAFKYFSGVAKILVPDNLKTGVNKAHRHSPEINKTYNEMAEYYDTVVIPARVRQPKDKASVEGNVGNITTWIIASLRNQEFFSFHELNLAIQGKLKEFNQKPFQKKDGCRESVFIHEEKHTLIPLPATDFELSQWRIATVQYNYHIQVEKMHYSVPYEYIKHKVDIRLTKHIIEVFFKGQRVASHRRLYGHPGQYQTLADHMPDNHRIYSEWNTERFISWAESIGENTAVTIKAILSAHKIEQQGYRSCMALLKLADKYSVNRLEAACKKALSYTPRPNYKNVQTILKTGSDKLREEPEPPKSNSNYGFTRGSKYFGRDR
jgi:transposase